MKGFVYQSACMAVDPGKYIAALSNAHLAALLGYLMHAGTGIPALILGLAEIEAARRWKQAQDAIQQEDRDCAGAMEGGSMP